MAVTCRERVHIQATVCMFLFYRFVNIMAPTNPVVRMRHNRRPVGYTRPCMCERVCARARMYGSAAMRVRLCAQGRVRRCACAHPHKCASVCACANV